MRLDREYARVAIQGARGAAQTGFVPIAAVMKATHQFAGLR
jgi:hypothetical protein